MYKRRTHLVGALLAAFTMSLAAGALAQDLNLDDQFSTIEKTISQYENRPPKVRQKAYREASKDLEQIRRDNPTAEITHRVLLLKARIEERTDKDPVGNSKYTAAKTYRKLIAMAGPGALDGKPVRGWPDRYVEQAYRDYQSLSGRVDVANRKTWEYRLVDFLVRMTGSSRAYSYWLAIAILTLIVKILTTPLSHMQFESMRNTQRIQPLLEKLRKDLADDPRELQKQQWQLMKDHGANPLMGCLPLLVQMPFLLLLYKLIRVYEFQFARGEFLWIGSWLADSVSWVGASLADSDWPLLILYGVSMYISTRMTSAGAVDKAQQDQQKMMSIMMPAMFVLIFNYFPSAFILYWLVLNVLTTTQQYFMLNKPVPALALEEDDEPEEAPAEALTAPSVARAPRPRKRR